MKERPIIFSGLMVRAILDGKKTQTRRVIKPQPADDIHQHTFPNEHAHGWWSSLRHKNGLQMAHFCPHGKKGEKLWVREAFYPHDDGIDSGGCSHVFYRATEELPFTNETWKPSIYMPRWASRITLEITGVRVERLNDISEDDCWEEGIEQLDGLYDSKIYDMAKRIGCSYEDAKPLFSCLWESINGVNSWHENPWVWVLEFQTVE